MKKHEHISEEGVYIGPEMKWRISDVEAEMEDMDIPKPYNREDLETILVATFEDNDGLVEAISEHIRATIAFKFNLPH